MVHTIRSLSPVVLFVCLFVVVIVDPGISRDDNCQSYNDGKKWDVFIKVTAFMQQMCITYRDKQ